MAWDCGARGGRMLEGVAAERYAAADGMEPGQDIPVIGAGSGCGGRVAAMRWGELHVPALPCGMGRGSGGDVCAVQSVGEGDGAPGDGVGRRLLPA